jgi:hypothetical protein
MNAWSTYAFNHLTLPNGEAKILLKAGSPLPGTNWNSWGFG